MDDFTKVLIETEQRSKSNSHRLDQVEKKLEDYGAMVTSIQVLSQKLDTIESKQKDIQHDVKELVSKPARRWEDIVRMVLEAIVGGLVVYMLAKMGIG